MNNIIKRTWKQGKMVNIEDLKGMTFQAEEAGHTFQISGVDEKGDPVAMSGTPAGVLLRPDNTDVTLTCSVSDGVVSATLPEEAYELPGRFGLTVFLTSDDQTMAIYAAVGYVSRTSSGTASPGTTASVVDLVDAIEAAIEQIPASDTALKAAIAPTYSTSGLYSVGSYAWHNGTLYRCIVSITSGETWTQGHWTEAAIGSDVSDLKNALYYDEFLINAGQYTIQKTDLESGKWANGTKGTDSTRGRVKNLLHVRSGMTIKYNNQSQTFDLFFGVYNNSGTSIQAIGWKTDKNGTISITKDGNLAMMIRDHATSGSANVDVANYDAEVVLSTDTKKNLDKTVIPYAQYNTREAWIAAVPSDKLADIPVNKIICIGSTVVNATDEPVADFIGNVITVSAKDSLNPGAFQIANKTGDMFVRNYVYSSSGNYWTEWKNVYEYAGSPVIPYAQYNSREEWIAAVPTDKLADIPVNKIVCIGSGDVNATDEPVANFVGNVITISARNSLNPGAFQIAMNNATRKIYIRTYIYRSSGHYWGAWYTEGEGEVYHVGTGQEYTSLTSLLLDLDGNERKKVIYLDEGTYDIFAEYLAEMDGADGRMVIPYDNIDAASYFSVNIPTSGGKKYWYNAFVPNNTRIVGLGNVTLKFMPTVEQLSALASSDTAVWQMAQEQFDGKTFSGMGASNTWSPLNIYGSVEIENITVLGKNCRYCLHNDDHNAYPGARQHYKNVKFIFRYSDSVVYSGQTKVLGKNNVIGFGLQKDGLHIFDDCEMYSDCPNDKNAPAYYGHDGSSSNNGTLLLRNCKIHSANFSNTAVIRLQTLSQNVTGKNHALFENCYINGGINLSMYYTTSIQSWVTTFSNCNKVPVSRSIATGGTIVDPYTVTWFNPLPLPTAQDPLIETDTYTPS